MRTEPLAPILTAVTQNPDEYIVFIRHPPGTTAKFDEIKREAIFQIHARKRKAEGSLTRPRKAADYSMTF